jgi:hypothetical protein
MTTIGEDGIQKGCNARVYLTIHRSQERGPGVTVASVNPILPGLVRI